MAGASVDLQTWTSPQPACLRHTHKSFLLPTQVRAMSQTKELPTIFDAATLVRKGLCPVMDQQNGAVQSHSIYFGEFF